MIRPFSRGPVALSAFLASAFEFPVLSLEPAHCLETILEIEPLYLLCLVAAAFGLNANCSCSV